MLSFDDLWEHLKGYHCPICTFEEVYLSREHFCTNPPVKTRMCMWCDTQETVRFEEGKN